jgi:hypothetical protein
MHKDRRPVKYASQQGPTLVQSATALMKPERVLPKPIHLLLYTIGLLPILFYLQLWWLDCWHFQVLAGDDVRCFPTALQGFDQYNNLLVSIFKFRPITTLFIWISALLSGGRYPGLLMMGVGLHSLNALLFFCLLRKVLRVSLIVALGLTFLASFNRFTAYLISPELAIMEGAAITCYLLFLWTLLRMIETAKVSWALGVGLSFLVILHVHERYMVLVGACLIAALLTYRANRTASLLTGGCALGVLAFNFAAKKFFLHSPILIGTTTQAIEFKPKIILGFFIDGMLNLGGINRGPSYLSILDYAEAPHWLKLFSLLSATFSLLVLGGAALYSYRSIKADRGESKAVWMLGLLLCLVFALVLSASITFRQEYRWLYAAYLTFLILLGLSARVHREYFKSPFAYFGVAALLVLAIPTELTIRGYRDNYYARGAYNTANKLYALIRKSPKLMSREEIVVGGDKVPNADWIFMGNAFAQYYHLPSLIFTSPNLGKSSPPENSLSVVYRQAGGIFTLPTPNDMDKVDLLRTAEIKNPPAYALSTPNGKPSFAFAQNGISGWCLTSPVELLIQIPTDARTMEITFSHCWANGDGLDLTITGISVGQQSSEFFAEHVPALKNAAISEWRSFRVKLPDKCVSLRLSIASKSGDQTADWLIFRNLSFDPH